MSNIDVDSEEEWVGSDSEYDEQLFSNQTTSEASNLVDLNEQRRMIQEMMKQKSVITQENKASFFSDNDPTMDSDHSDDDANAKIIPNTKCMEKLHQFEEEPHPMSHPDNIALPGKTLEKYQQLLLDEQCNEELIQQKSTATTRSIHPNQVFSLSLLAQCTLFGIIGGLLLSNFDIKLIPYISLLVLLSMVILGLNIWFGCSETIEERISVTQLRSPINNLLSTRAITFWKSSEYQTTSQYQPKDTTKYYVDKETRDKFADKDEDDIIEGDIKQSGLNIKTPNHYCDEEFNFSDEDEDIEEEINQKKKRNKKVKDNDGEVESTHPDDYSSHPKVLFRNETSRKTKAYIRKVKRLGEKDYFLYGSPFPSYRNGRWIPSYNENFETFKHQPQLKNLRDDTGAGQRNSIIPNIRLKNDDDYRASKTFTEIEMDNIKNNVTQHREELYNFGVDSIQFLPIITPNKIKELCKMRKLTLKFD